MIERPSVVFACTVLLCCCAGGVLAECEDDTFSVKAPTIPVDAVGWLNLIGRIVACLVLICFSGLFSGLTLGLLGLDLQGLEVIMAGKGSDDKDEQTNAQHAAKIMEIRKDGNLLLCTLLLGNVAVNSLLSILSADLTGGIVGFFLSTAFVVVFGEIIPQATCSRYALIIGANDGNVYSMGTAAGALRWNVSTGGMVFAGATLDPGDGGATAFIGSGDGAEYALRSADGAVLWRFATGGPVYSNPTVSAAAAGRPEVLYTGSADHKLYALTAKEGKPLWSADLGGPVASFSILSPAGDALYVGCHDGRVYKVSTAGGVVQWSFETAAQVQSDQTMSADGATLYIGSDDGLLYALDTASGRPRWNYTAGGAVQSGITLNGAEDTVFFGSYDNFVYAVATAGGALRWRTATGGQVGSKPKLWPRAPHTERYLLQGSFDGKMYCLDAASGAQIWAFATEGPVHSDPTLSEDGQRVFFGSYDNFVYALSTGFETEARPGGVSVRAKNSTGPSPTLPKMLA